MNIPPRATCSLHLPTKPGPAQDQLLGPEALPSGASGHPIGDEIQSITKSSRLAIKSCTYPAQRLYKFSLLNLKWMPKRPHNVLPNQHGSHLAALRFGHNRRSRPRIQSSWCPILLKQVFGVAIPSHLKLIFSEAPK